MAAAPWSSMTRKDHHCHHHNTTGLVAMLSSAGLRGLEPSPQTVTPSKRPLYPMLDPLDESGDSEIADDGTTGVPGLGSEKKRRLTVEQVRSLEISFETENRLEPVRKMQLAQDLGLQPRQVAVWFQNRRARWKTKQLERDYDVLKSAYESLVEENKKLKSQLDRLNKASDNDENNNNNNMEEVDESRALEKANLKSSGLVEDEDACCTTPESPTVVSSKFKDSPLSSSDGYNSDVLDAFSPHLAPRVYEKSRLAPPAASVKEEPFPYKLDEELQALDDHVPYNCLFEEEEPGNWAWWEWS